MQTAPARASKTAPISGTHEGYAFEATIHGYAIMADGITVKIERSTTTADVRTNAQRAKQWISNQITPQLARRSWFD